MFAKTNKCLQLTERVIEYCKSKYIREGLYFAKIREQVHSRIHNSREVCSNIVIRLFVRI